MISLILLLLQQLVNDTDRLSLSGIPFYPKQLALLVLMPSFGFRVVENPVKGAT
jgi:hypothetical protein